MAAVFFLFSPSFSAAFNFQSLYRQFCRCLSHNKTLVAFGASNRREASSEKKGPRCKSYWTSQIPSRVPGLSKKKKEKCNFAVACNYGKLHPRRRAALCRDCCSFAFAAHTQWMAAPPPHCVCRCQRVGALKLVVSQQPGDAGCSLVAARDYGGNFVVGLCCMLLVRASV